MSYHSHKLNSASHSHIIGRTDSITGDKIKENDKVVFCLNCQSCFLEESWNYMGNRHCEQNQTLGFIPVPPPQLIAKKKAQKLIAELTESMMNPFPSIIAIIIFAFICYFIFRLNEISSVVIAVLLGILTGIILKIKKIRKITGIGREELRIYESYIETENLKFFWNEIKQIDFKRTMRVEIDVKNGRERVYSDTPSVRIILKDGKFTDIKLPTKNYPRIKPFLFGLAWASQFTSIHFYTEHKKEYGLVKSFDRNYQGTIKIALPTQLVYNPEES